MGQLVITETPEDGSRLATTDQVEADAGWPREGRAWEEKLPKRQSGPAEQYCEFSESLDANQRHKGITNSHPRNPREPGLFSDIWKYTENLNELVSECLAKFHLDATINILS